MQERLDKWRKNTLPVPSSKVLSPHLDDETDEEKIYRKDREAWAAQLESDPRHYRR